MNVFNKVTLQSLKKNKTRTIVTIIGIILSAAMIRLLRKQESVITFQTIGQYGIRLVRMSFTSSILVIISSQNAFAYKWQGRFSYVLLDF